MSERDNVSGLEPTRIRILYSDFVLLLLYAIYLEPALALDCQKAFHIQNLVLIEHVL